MKLKQPVKRSRKLSSGLRKEKASSRWPEQLELVFERSKTPVAASLWDASRFAERSGYKRDVDLELKARELLRDCGIDAAVQVEWNPRLKTCAGRADFRAKSISLNPRLREHPPEIERTFRHELAHLLAQFREKNRRRIRPHGQEWRRACVDLGIGDEKRCHSLPFPICKRVRRFLYKCPNCKDIFPRVRRIRRAIACLACCRAHNGGRFDARFRLRLASS